MIMARHQHSPLPPLNNIFTAIRITQVIKTKRHWVQATWIKKVRLRKGRVTKGRKVKQDGHRELRSRIASATGTEKARLGVSGWASMALYCCIIAIGFAKTCRAATGCSGSSPLFGHFLATHWFWGRWHDNCTFWDYSFNLSLVAAVNYCHVKESRNRTCEVWMQEAIILTC